MVEKKCPYCGRDKDLKITYYNKQDGTGLNMFCTDCMNAFFKNQPHYIE